MRAAECKKSPVSEKLSQQGGKIWSAAHRCSSQAIQLLLPLLYAALQLINLKQGEGRQEEWKLENKGLGTCLCCYIKDRMDKMSAMEKKNVKNEKAI